MIDSKWDVRMLQLACLVASWSKDPSTKCGAVITDSQHRIISTGYNGLAQGIPDNESVWDNREEKYEHVIHAEENTIIFAGHSLRDCYIYTWPIAPCSRCASKIIQAGISRVVAPQGADNTMTRWAASIRRAEWMYRNSGVYYVWLTDDDLESGGLLHPSADKVDNVDTVVT
jgi:dCMP deaminase